jgi:hypothetical protein
MEIGVAYSGSVEAEENIVWSWLWYGDIEDFDTKVWPFVEHAACFAGFGYFWSFGHLKSGKEK